MEKFKFDFNVDRTESLNLFKVYAGKNYPDVAVIFKTPTPNGKFYYSGSISISLLEKLFINPTYKVNIIDKLYVLNCPDRMLLGELKRFKFYEEVDCNTVRLDSSSCQNGFRICDCTATGEEIFPNNIKVEKVPLQSISSLELPFIMYSRLSEVPPSIQYKLMKQSYHGDTYWINDRKDLVYFMSNSNTVQIYYPEDTTFPDSINSKASLISPEESWIYTSANRDSHLEKNQNTVAVSSDTTNIFVSSGNLKTDRINSLIKPFVFNNTSFSARELLSLLVNLLDG